MSLKLFFVLSLAILVNANAFTQNDFVISRAKSIDTEYTPKPRDFKIKKLSWGELKSDCISETVSHGTWMKFYPNSRKLRVTLSCGMNWGTITDPLMYIAYLDTINGLESLEELGCIKVQGSIGDYSLEVLDLKPKRKHYLLIGGDADKLNYALYLTEKFEPGTKAEETSTQSLADEKIQEKAFEKVEQTIKTGMIIGRVRRIDASPVASFGVSLLNDDLVQQSTTRTDEFGTFKLYDVNPENINLVRMEGDDSKLLVDMFLYNAEARIIGKPIYLGHRLHSFTARKEYYEPLAILSRKDVVVDVQLGDSYMTGKVVDKETYLIGREGVKVGLYTPKKSFVNSAVTDFNGKFEFQNLDSSDYIVRVDHNPLDDYVEIVLTDDNNVPYAYSNSNNQDDEGYFRFSQLPEDEVEMTLMDTRDTLKLKHHAYKDLVNEKPGVALELTSIEFAVGASSLGFKENKELNHLAEELLANPEINILISGHTDNVGAPDKNLRLSKERAEAVKSYLVGKGVAYNRIACQGVGPREPIASNDTAEGRLRNRRVEFKIMD